jgi:surface protein
MQLMFYQVTSFNGDISQWNTEEVKFTGSMFKNAISFNQDISEWKTEKVMYMDNMYENAESFNQDISDWDVSNVRKMYGMFRAATSFNGDISGWNTGKVNNMQFMFYQATSFNGNISGWNTEEVAVLNNMFTRAVSFNVDISGWNIGKVTNMGYMFNEATSFNVDISEWNIGKVKHMQYMFNGAGSFDQDLCSWLEYSLFPQNVDTLNMISTSSGCTNKNSPSASSVCQTCFFPVESVVKSFSPIELRDGGRTEYFIGTVLDPPRTNFRISFTITPFSIPNSHASVLRFANKEDYGNMDSYGDRSPLLLLSANSLIFYVNQGSTQSLRNHFYADTSLTLNQGNDIVLDYIGNDISLYLNGLSVGSMSVPVNYRLQIDQWLIYGAGKHYGQTNADIVNLTIELVDVPFPTKSMITTFRPVKPLTAGNLIGTVINPPHTGFDISFTMTPFSTFNAWTSILRFTNRENYSNVSVYGDRAPALFLAPNGLKIGVRYGSTKDANHNFHSNRSLNMNVANKVKLSFSGDGMSLYINGALAGSMTIPFSNRPHMDKWFIYGSDKFYNPVDANIVDLTIELTTCAARTTASMCTGDCFWYGGNCFAYTSLAQLGVTPSVKLGQCQGDCDRDSDCLPGLKCYHRSNFGKVPGCVGDGINNDLSWYDYCTMFA